MLVVVGTVVRTLERRALNKGLRYSADWTCVAAANFPCVVRFTCSVNGLVLGGGSTVKSFTWSFIHSLCPFLERPFEGVVDQGVKLVWITLDEAEIQGARGHLFGVVLLLSFVILILLLSLNVFHVLQSFLEVILSTLPLVSLFLNKLKGAEPQPPVLVRFGK